MTHIIPVGMQRLARQIRRSVVFEDRLEYDAEMLARIYGLTPDQGEALHWALHRLAIYELLHQRLGYGR